MEMNVKKALTELGKEPVVEHTDLATARTEKADLFIGTKDIIHSLDDGTRKIIALENIMNLEEIKEKLSPYL